MTARSGDALSHANFQSRAGVVLTAINCPRSAFGAPRNIALRRGRIGSGRICMAGMSGAAGTNLSDSFHLNIT